MIPPGKPAMRNLQGTVKHRPRGNAAPPPRAREGGESIAPFTLRAVPQKIQQLSPLTQPPHGG